MQHVKLQFCSCVPTELREAFAIFDKDGDGFITSSELQDVMKSLREKFTKEDIHSMIQQVDVDGKLSTCHIYNTHVLALYVYISTHAPHIYALLTSCTIMRSIQYALSSRIGILCIIKIGENS